MKSSHGTSDDHVQEGRSHSSNFNDAAEILWEFAAQGHIYDRCKQKKHC